MASDLSITIVEARKPWINHTLKILRRNNFKPRVSQSVPKKKKTHTHIKLTSHAVFVRKLFEVCFYKIRELIKKERRERVQEAGTPKKEKGQGDSHDSNEGRFLDGFQLQSRKGISVKDGPRTWQWSHKITMELEHSCGLMMQSL